VRASIRSSRKFVQKTNNNEKYYKVSLLEDSDNGVPQPSPAIRHNLSPSILPCRTTMPKPGQHLLHPSAFMETSSGSWQKTVQPGSGVLLSP
jgi:hypothetical protein